MRKIIWGNVVVKNEDRYLWFAIKSVIDHLDKIIIYDTGSTDQTVKIIKLLKRLYPQKIQYKEIGEVNPIEFSQARQEMLIKSKSDWIFLLDGDEVWPESSIKALIKAINTSNNIECIVSPVKNLVGDIFHYQEEQAGKYKLLGKVGHFNIRAVNKKIPGLHIDRPYGSEGFFDNKNVLIQDRDQDNILFVDKPYLHFTHLTRSTIYNGDKNVMQRAKKIKYEIGKKFDKKFEYPKVFFEKYPQFVSDPWTKMDMKYKIRAVIQTPFKKIKRRIFK